MSLLICKPLYAVSSSKFGVLVGGARNGKPNANYFKFDFSDESLTNTVKYLSDSRSHLATLGFSGEVVSAGGQSFQAPTNIIESFNLTTHATVVLNSYLSLPRDYLSSAGNLNYGIYVAGRYGKPVALIDKYNPISKVVTLSHHLSSVRFGHTSTSNSKDAIIAGSNFDVDSYNFLSEATYTRFTSKLKLQGLASSSSMDSALMSGGKTDYPVSYQYKVRYSDLVEVSISSLSVNRLGASSLSNGSIALILGGSGSSVVDKVNFFDTSTTVGLRATNISSFSGYNTNCHGGTVQ